MKCLVVQVEGFWQRLLDNPVIVNPVRGARVILAVFDQSLWELKHFYDTLLKLCVPPPLIVKRRV